jgi:hypothetical protein
MRYVHSLLRRTLDDALGWCAPWEVDEETPQYVGFAVPLEDGNATDRYACEVVTLDHSGRRSVQQYDLVKVGTDSFALDLDDDTVRFHLRRVAPHERRLPGRQVHALASGKPRPQSGRYVAGLGRVSCAGPESPRPR